MKVLAIGSIVKPLTDEQRKEIMPKEVPNTLKLYLDGKVFYPDPYEAGKWYLLWQNNRSQMQLGQVEFDPALSKQLNGYSADVWAEAKARAKSWKQTISEPGAP